MSSFLRTRRASGRSEQTERGQFVDVNGDRQLDLFSTSLAASGMWLQSSPRTFVNNLVSGGRSSLGADFDGDGEGDRIGEETVNPGQPNELYRWRVHFRD